MPGRGMRHTAEIARLRQQGLSDARIAERLSVARSIVTRNLSQDRAKQRLSRLMSQAGVDSLKTVLVSCEVTRVWIETERLKQIEGKSELTAENIGTIMRNQEKALEMARTFLGTTFSPEGPAKTEKKDDRLTRAREVLKEIEARKQGVPVKE